MGLSTSLILKDDDIGLAAIRQDQARSEATVDKDLREIGLPCVAKINFEEDVGKPLGF
jgi:hypothetical protein